MVDICSSSHRLFACDEAAIEKSVDLSFIQATCSAEDQLGIAVVIEHQIYSVTGTRFSALAP